MSGGVYGGDEVGALVFDAGHYTFRAGYAGEEFPKVDLPSDVAVMLDEKKSETESMDTSETNARKTEAHDKRTPNASKRYIIDPVSRCIPREGLEIQGFLKDGCVEDWDMFESLLDYVYKRPLLCEPKFHPVLMSEPALTPKHKREQMAELMFEKFEVPAFYLSKTPVLSAFANGRPSGLVLDSGASYTTASAVYDGYCLANSVVKTQLGGDMLTDQCRKYLQQEKIEIVPQYLIASKDPVKAGDSAVWKKKTTLPKVGDSFREAMIKEVVQDFQAAVLQLSDKPYNQDDLETIVGNHYEFPSGYNREFVEERLRISECLFDVSYLIGVPSGTVMSISQAAATSIGLCDIDIRSSLYSSIMVTGGNSLVHGFIERLQHDLTAKCPANCKLRVLAAPSQQERRYGAWSGGSILSSLGSFQQMWISRQEYDESGKGIVEKKCQ